MTANLQLQPPPQLPIQAFSAVDRACDVASGALCDDPVGPLDPPPPPPRQRRRFPRIRTPSIAESPVGPKPCQARSSTSATQTLRQHHHAIDRSPRTEPSFERALSRSALGMEAFASLLGYRWPPPRPLTGKPPGSHDPERRPCSADACARLCVERALRPPTEASRARSHRLSPDGLPPTRSARTPPVVEPHRRRLETPALPAIPPRAASPGLPRRRPGFAAPEVPSIDEPARPWQLRRSVTTLDRESALEGPTLTGDPELSTACHQDVENTGAITALQRFMRSPAFRCP